MLHRGHVEYLEAAQRKAHEMGMPLLVAVNSDDSVRRLKGAGRPINSLENRIAVLAALRYVDAVTWFNEDTPIRVVELVRPMLLIKAEDYWGKEIVGSELVISLGGDVWLAPYVKGLSTSAILEGGRSVQRKKRPESPRT